MVAIGSGVDAGQTLAAFDEVKDRPPAKLRGSLVVRVVQNRWMGPVLVPVIGAKNSDRALMVATWLPAETSR
jgi:hypothetical protein